jgi:hypothetical protein
MVLCFGTETLRQTKHSFRLFVHLHTRFKFNHLRKYRETEGALQKTFLFWQAQFMYAGGWQSQESHHLVVQPYLAWLLYVGAHLSGVESQSRDPTKNVSFQVKVHLKGGFKPSSSFICGTGKPVQTALCFSI